MIELSIYSGIFVFNVWIVPFWFWGIYHLDLAFPEGLKILFYKLWHETFLVAVISYILGSCFLLISFLIRRNSLKELGIRLDNFYRSGRECAMICALLAIMIMIMFFSISYFGRFDFHSLSHHFKGFLENPLLIVQRIGQQFLLQSVVLIRFIQLFGRRSIAVVSATGLFALAHSPNTELMILSFVFGLICCLLFLRNRNIFTIGLMHIVLTVFLSSLIVPEVLDTMKVGPRRGSPEFLAEIEYNGDKIVTNPSEKKGIPIFVINKSIATWDSNHKDHPVFISYHLLDAKGDMVQYDNLRTPFPKVIRADESATVDLMIHAPPERGEYYLEVDIVKEKIRWFKSRDSKTVLIYLSVK